MQYPTLPTPVINFKATPRVTTVVATPSTYFKVIVHLEMYRGRLPRDNNIDIFLQVA